MSDRAELLADGRQGEDDEEEVERVERPAEEAGEDGGAMTFTRRAPGVWSRRADFGLECLTHESDGEMRWGGAGEECVSSRPAWPSLRGSEPAT